jgi:hypothetical protein
LREMKKIQLPFTATIPLALLLAASVAAAGRDTYSVLWKPKPNDRAVYALSIESTVQGQSIAFEAELHTKVSQVKPDGTYTVVSQIRAGKAKIAGMEQVIGDDLESEDSYDVRGRRIGDRADREDPFSAVLSQVSESLGKEEPVRIGEKWVVELPRDEKAAIPAARVEYEAVAVERVGQFESLKIRTAFAQSEGAEPMRLKGYVWNLLKDGSLVSMSLKIENLRFEEDLPPTSALLKMTRNQ